MQKKKLLLGCVLLLVIAISAAAVAAQWMWASQPVGWQIKVVGLGGYALVSDNAGYEAKTNAISLTLISTTIPTLTNVPALTIALNPLTNIASDLQMKVSVSGQNGIVCKYDVYWGVYYLDGAVHRKAGILKESNVAMDAFVTMPVADIGQVMYDSVLPQITTDPTIAQANGLILVFNFGTTGTTWGTYNLVFTVSLGAA